MIQLFYYLLLPLMGLTSQPELRLGGELDFYLEYNQSPSSKAGQSAFEFSRFELLPVIDLNHEQDQLTIEMRWDLAEERDTSNGYQSKMENAFIQWLPARTEMWTHQIGLIRPYWRTQEGQIAEFDNFGDSSKNLSRRYRFLSDGDLGYQGAYQWNKKHKISFSFINGEENKSSEVGVSKEVQFGYFYNFEDVLWSGWLSFGQVDQVEDSVSEKSRLFLRHQNRWGRVGLGLEILLAADSNTDLENNQRAEGMTFTDLTQPENIKTDAYRVEFYYTLNPLQQALIRFDTLRVNINDKGLTSYTAAWLKSEPGLFDWGLYYESTLYGRNHSARSRQVELARLGISKVF